MSEQIFIVNSNHAVNPYTFEVNFGQTFTARDHEITLKSANIAYSNFNISASIYNNHQFSYVWSDGTQVDITLPDGFYSLSDINNYMHNEMKNRGQYLWDDLRQTEYYLLNITQITYLYRFMIEAIPLSDYSASDISNPNSLTLNDLSPYLIINDNGLVRTLGFAAGNYPTTYSALVQQLIGVNAPIITEVSCFLVGCNFVSNSAFQNYTGVLAMVPLINTSFGSSIEYKPVSQSWYDVIPGPKSKLQITLQDDQGNLLRTAQDNASSFLVAIRRKKD